jgi:hypothetical protein
MNRLKLLYIVDVLMGLAFLVLAGIGLMMFFFLPGGVPRSGQQEVLGVLKRRWLLIHAWAGLVFVVLIVIHLVLHWEWIVCTTKKYLFPKKSKD